VDRSTANAGGDLMPARVLLCGASGFLGANFLAHALDTTDWELVCPASFSHRGVPERISLTVAPDNWKRVDVVTCDLAAPIADTTATRFGQVDYIINFASESSIPRSLADPVPFVRNNVDLMLALLEYARTLPALKAFVQISTDEVYGPCPQGAHREWDPILPSTPYSASKAAQEALAIAYYASFSLPLVLVNTMNPLGPMQDPEKFLPTLIRQIGAGETVRIHASADGTVSSRPYIHAADLAEAILFLLARPVGQGERPDRWNVVGRRDVNNLGLAVRVADALNMPLHHELVGDPAGRALRYALDGAKLAAAGWSPSRDVDSTVTEMVAWSQANPLWARRSPRV
jgi:dTDP-glucose 4,6-dehydratase